MTRNRQPKRIAYVLRDRYRQIPSLNLEAGTKRYTIEPDEYADYDLNNRDKEEQDKYSDAYYDKLNVITV